MLAIKAENLSKTYAGEGAPVTVFSNLSFELPVKAFAAVMGPSGVGKSTLLHLLGGIDNSDSGRVEIFGESLGELPPRERGRGTASHTALSGKRDTGNVTGNARFPFFVSRFPPPA